LKKITLAKNPLKHIPANDNPIDVKDVPVADRKHWLGEIDRGAGFGFRAIENHPYRLAARYGRDSSGKWDFSHPLPPIKITVRKRDIEWADAPLFDTQERDPIEASRIVLAKKADDERRAMRPQRYRLAVRANIGAPQASRELLEEARPLLATPEERKWAGEGLPVEAEFRTGRIAEILRDTAADFVDVYETANREGTAISERRIDAKRAAAFIRYRTMHLWRPLVDALIFGKTMSAIGREYGGNKEDAAKLGRQKVVDALLIAKECFVDMADMKKRERQAEAGSTTIEDPHVSTLGRKSGDLPKTWHQAANDNRAAILKVA
jgi:hypothetical protein